MCGQLVDVAQATPRVGPGFLADGSRVLSWVRLNHTVVWQGVLLEDSRPTLADYIDNTHA